MSEARIIPHLTLHDRKLVKTLKFRNETYIGDPVNAVKIFNDKEVDEIIITDIWATRNSMDPNFGLIEQIASECFCPMTYGGGVSSLAHAKTLFSLGIEKLCLQTGALNTPSLVRDLSDIYGSQSITISIDVKKNFFNGWSLFSSDSRKKMNLSWKDFGQTMVDSGAGEILLNNVDLDGTLLGPDLDLIKEAAQLFPVPLVVQGGIGSIQDVSRAFRAGADAIAAGAFFVYRGSKRGILISYPPREEVVNGL